MTKYMIVKRVGSGEIVYSGMNRDAAFGVFGEDNRKMYEISLDSETHELLIDSSLWLSGGQASGDHMRIPRNVLKALLGDYAPSFIEPKPCDEIPGPSSDEREQ